MHSKSLLASLVLIGLGCDMDDDPPAPSHTSDAAALEHAAPPAGLRVMTEDGPAPADLACLGRRDQPAGAPPRSFTMPAFSFGQVDSEGKRVAIAGLEVQLFADNRIPASTACEEGCMLATDEGDGRYTFEAPEDGWLAYRVLERAASGDGSRIMSSVEVNLVPGPDEALNTVLAPVIDGVYMALEIPRDDTRATVAGRLLDCSGQLVEGATIALRHSDGKAIATDEHTRVIYLDDTGPNPTRLETPFTGQWSVTNVPVGSGQVIVEARAENGEIVACELAATAGDTLSVLRLHPLRADAPAACAR